MNKTVDKGALWEKTTQKGDTYYSGNVEINGEKFYVSFFKNNKHEGNQPMWRTIDKKPSPDLPDRGKGDFEDYPF